MMATRRCEVLLEERCAHMERNRAKGPARAQRAMGVIYAYGGQLQVSSKAVRGGLLCCCVCARFEGWAPGWWLFLKVFFQQD